MNEFLTVLKAKEKELEAQLSQNSIFKQLEGVRTTIALFQNGTSENGHEPTLQTIKIPAEYSSDLTWKERVLFVLNKLNTAYVSQIVEELKRLGAKDSEEALSKRVGVTVSAMKKKKILGVKWVGKKGEYFIKG